MPEKKKTKLGDIGEMPSPDIKQQRSEKYLNVSDVKGTPAGKKGSGSIGGYATYGESETKSAGRAMQVQKTKEAGQALAQKMAEEAIKRMKKK